MSSTVDSSAKALVAAALAAREQAYAPYSKFRVGAALLADDQTVFRGCNVENVSYGLTNCAERTAVFTAVQAERRRFSAIAIASKGGVLPCGACLQVLAEFCDDLPIYLVDADHPERWVSTRLQLLLPNRFRFHPGE